MWLLIMGCVGSYMIKNSSKEYNKQQIIGNLLACLYYGTLEKINIYVYIKIT